MKKFSSQRLAAFTLTELLVVLVIIGILILLALPVMMPLITRDRSIEAKNSLKHLHSLQKTYFYEHAKYSPSLDEIGFETEKLATDSEDGKANYRCEVAEASNATFLARATAVVDFDGDGQMNVWEIDHEGNLRETVKD